MDILISISEEIIDFIRRLYKIKSKDSIFIFISKISYISIINISKIYISRINISRVYISIVYISKIYISIIYIYNKIDFIIDNIKFNRGNIIGNKNYRNLIDNNRIEEKLKIIIRGRKQRIFIKRLTTTIIFVNLLLLGKSTIKLIKISYHLYIRIGSS